MHSPPLQWEEGNLGKPIKRHRTPSQLGLRPCFQFRIIVVNKYFCSTKKFIVVDD